MDTETRGTNILLILTDQHRWDTLGCYGAPTCRTPHLDALAGRGVRFDLAYTSAIACSPSRASLFTGQYPHKHGVTGNNLGLQPGIPTLATELGAAGYHLGYAGKWHADHARVPGEHGFLGRDFPGYGFPLVDGTIRGVEYHRTPVANGLYEPTHHYADYLQAHGYPEPELLHAHYGESPQPGRREHEIYGLQSGTIDHTFEAMVVEHTVEVMRELKRRSERDGKPFFLWANFWGPHTPCLVPEPYYSMYDPGAIPEDPSFCETWDRKPRRQRVWEDMWGLSANGWAGWSEIVARYWGYVTMLDELTGRILAELRELGLMDDTMVVFSTDHGDTMGAHRIIEKGPFGYEEAHRLPLIAAHPGCVNPGSASAQPVYLQDLFPTFLDVAGRSAPDACDHRSILGNILGEDASSGRDSLFAYGRHGLRESMRVLRTRTHKLVLMPSAEGVVHDMFDDPWEVLELYDLVNDPHELRNLIDLPEAADVQAELMGLMRRRLAELDDPLLEYLDGLNRRPRRA